MVELIPGTALPIAETGAAGSGEGRGEPRLLQPRGRSLLEALDDNDGLSPGERAVVEAALRAYDVSPKFERHVFAVASGKTDAATGNLVLPLMVIPAGMEGQIAQVTVDIPGSATINPSAPFANAASWAFLATSGPTLGPQGPSASQADALRAGMIAFAPSSAAGPIIPGQWTFSDDNGPIVWGGAQLLYVVHGGSIAAILNQTVQVTYRINLYTKQRV